MQTGARKIIFSIGALLVLAGLGLALRIPYFYIHAHAVSTNLLRQMNPPLQPPSVANNTRSTALTVTNEPFTPSVPLALPSSATLLGEIKIPQIRVTAPVLQGTDDVELNIAVGHLPTSAYPGSPGTSVIAAHNATFFRHIDQLKPGATIQIQTKDSVFTFSVVEAKIVHVGDPVLNTALPSLVLESCYPLNALYLTPERYLVTAKFVSAKTNLQSEQTTESSDIYTADIPFNLTQTARTLSANHLPMGTLSYSGAPAESFIQSSAPLSATNVITQLYLAFVHASTAENLSDLHALWPSASLQELQSTQTNPLFGYKVNNGLDYRNRFNITLAVQASSLQSATATTDIQIGSATYHVTCLFSLSFQHKIHIEKIVIERVNQS